MWPQATMFAVGFLLAPFPAFVATGRNLPALLPDLYDLLASLYTYFRDEFVRPFSVELTSLHRRWRRSWGH